MNIRIKSLILAVITASSVTLADAQDSVIKPDCFECPSKIIVRGRLARILTISECKGISGMSCQIQFKSGTTLPSRIRIQELDRQNRVIAKKFLIYPNLKAEEKGQATFLVGSAKTKVVLIGEWQGGWRDEY